MRRPTAAAIAAMLFGPMMLIGSPGVGGQVNAAETSEGSIQELRTCVAEQRQLAVLFLVDTSQSLKKTDPAEERVVALQSAVSTLQTLQDASAGSANPVDVYVDFVEFGSVPKQTFPDRSWLSLEGTGDELIQEIERGYRGNNNSEDTDYVAALEPWSDRADPTRPFGEAGALERLALAPEGACRLLVWFTDGRFDIDFQNTPKTLNWLPEPQEIRSNADEAGAEARGEQLLCFGPTALTDRLRADDFTSGEGAVVAAVALGDPSTFDLIGSVAEGSRGTRSCGSKPPRGVFLGAQDVSSLVLQLRQAVLGDDNGPSIGSTGIDTGNSADCANSGGVESFDYPFFLNQGLTAFNVLMLSGDNRVTSTIVTPDGTLLPLTGRSTNPLPNGALLSVSRLPVANGGFQVSGALSGESAAWTGQWKVRFCADDPAVAAQIKNNASIYVFGSLEAKLRNSDVVARKGRTATVVVELVSAAGTPATSTSFASGSVIDVVINGELQPPVPVNADGTFEYPYDVPTDFLGDSLDIEATLKPVIQLDPSAPAVTLETWSGELGSLRVEPLPKFPLIDPPAPITQPLDQRNTEVTTTFRVDASAPESGGCVVLESLELTRFDGGDGTPSLQLFDGDTPVVVGDECAVSLDDGETRDLRLVVSIAGVTLDHESVLAGVARFRSVSAVDESQSESAELEFSAQVLPLIITDIDESTVWGLLVLALLLPLAILYLANWWSARLDLGRAALAELPVIFEGGRLWSRDSNGQRATLTLLDDDVNIGRLPNAGRHRAIDAGGLKLTGYVPRNPFADVSARALVPAARTVVSSRGSDHRGTTGRLGASLTRAWVFSSDDVARKDESGHLLPLSGALWLIVTPDPDRARRNLADSIENIEDRIDRTLVSHAVAADVAVGLAVIDDTNFTPQVVDPLDPVDPARQRPRVPTPTTPSLDDFFGGTTEPQLPPPPEPARRRPRGRHRADAATPPAADLSQTLDDSDWLN